MGGASKASQSGLCNSTIGLCSGAAIGQTLVQTFNLRCFKKQSAPDPEDRADALSARLTALPVHYPPFGLPVFCVAGLAVRQNVILRADTGSGRSRTARGGA